MPTLHIIAGPNGVGKTTFANHYLPEEVRQLEFVNADLIARGLSPYDPELAAGAAGRIALRRIHELISKRMGFTLETTLSGRTPLRWLTQARSQGYLLKAYFLWVNDPEIVLKRVRHRVTEGGHNIPENVSRRRFYKTLSNFLTIYRPIMHVWKLYVNDTPGPRLIAVEKDTRLAVRDRSVWDQLTSENLT